MTGVGDPAPDTAEHATVGGAHAGARITVVGIGADGWDGLSERARHAVNAADEVIGSARQLSTLPFSTPPHRVWTSPLGPMLDEILARPDGDICVLASGNPMHYGIGATIVRRLGSDAVQNGRVRIISQPSAFAMALARLGWAGEGVRLASTVGRHVSGVGRLLQPGRQLIVYVSGADGAAELAAHLVRNGFGSSRFYVLEQLGSAAEKVTVTTAAEWGVRAHDLLSTVAIEVEVDPGERFLPQTPGLPDDAFTHDGQITKRHVRATTLAALAPSPHQLLWDIGAGSGSIGIEWLRAEPTAEAIAIEQNPERAARIAENADALGVRSLRVVQGAVPEALDELDTAPNAIFIGGGLSTGVIEQAWERLAPGGRLVANGVTLEAERTLIDARAALGGDLVKLEVSHADPLGTFTAWRPALPIVQWSVWKP